MPWLAGLLVGCDGSVEEPATVEAFPGAEIFVHGPDGALSDVVVAGEDGVVEVWVARGSFVSFVFEATSTLGTSHYLFVLVRTVGGVSPGDAVRLNSAVPTSTGSGPLEEALATLDTSALSAAAPATAGYVAGLLAPSGASCDLGGDAWAEEWAIPLSDHCRGQGELFPFVVAFVRDGPDSEIPNAFGWGEPTTAEASLADGVRVEGPWRTDWAEVPTTVTSAGALQWVSVGSSAQPFGRSESGVESGEVALTARLLPLPDPTFRVSASGALEEVWASWDRAPAEVALDFEDAPASFDHAAIHEGPSPTLDYGPVVDSGDSLRVELAVLSEDPTLSTSWSLTLPPDAPSPLPLPDWRGTEVERVWALASMTREQVVGREWADVEAGAYAIDPYVRWRVKAPVP